MIHEQNQADQNYVRRVGEENRRYTQDLLSENENLRLMVSELQKERHVLIERGAKHQAGPNFASRVVVSERLVTGQNPASATGVAEAMVGLLSAATR